MGFFEYRSTENRLILAKILEMAADPSLGSAWNIKAPLWLFGL